MSKLALVPGGHSVLHEPAEPVDEMYFTDRNQALRELTDELHQMREKHQGVGLAAPQVGVPMQVFVLSYGGRIIEAMNPEIIKWSGNTEVRQEGCISFPGVFLPIQRDTRIKVQYRALDGSTKRYYLSDMQARIFQHEYDHLQGITIKTRHEGA